MMYVLEYLIYHLKPYGYNTVVKTVCSNDKTKIDNSTTAIAQGNNSTKGQTVNRQNGVAAAERGNILDEKIQEDFVENSEMIDRELNVNIKEQNKNDGVDRIESNINVGKNYFDTKSLRNPDAKVGGEKLENSRLLNALSRRNL